MPAIHSSFLENAPTCLENTPKIPKKKTQNGHFSVLGSVFSGIFGACWGKFRESRISGRGGYFFWVFFVDIPGRAISGLCSRSGRTQLFSEVSKRGWREGVGD